MSIVNKIRAWPYVCKCMLVPAYVVATAWVIAAIGLPDMNDWKAFPTFITHIAILLGGAMGIIAGIVEQYPKK